MQHESIAWRNKTLRKRGAHICFAFAKETDVMQAITIEADYKADKFFKRSLQGMIFIIQLSARPFTAF
jgi:hypothetical protein